jgi:hypothetical protein
MSETNQGLLSPVFRSARVLALVVIPPLSLNFKIFYTRGRWEFHTAMYASFISVCWAPWNSPFARYLSNIYTVECFDIAIEMCPAYPQTSPKEQKSPANSSKSS